jgi:hypothetical protein
MGPMGHPRGTDPVLPAMRNSSPNPADPLMRGSEDAPHERVPPMMDMVIIGLTFATVFVLVLVALARNDARS